MANTDKILVMKGCETCDTLKSNGLCKEEKCVDVNSKEGIKLVKQIKAEVVPQRVCFTKKGIAKKCSTDKIISKFSRKRKK